MPPTDPHVEQFVASTRMVRLWTDEHEQAGRRLLRRAADWLDEQENEQAGTYVVRELRMYRDDRASGLYDVLDMTVSADDDGLAVIDAGASMDLVAG